MSLIIYSPDFSDWAEIANAISVQYSVYYNDIGKLILDVPINADNAAALKNDCIFYDTVKKLPYIVKNVKTDTKENKITANGFTTNQILNDRVIATPVALRNIESGVYSVVNDNLRGKTRIATAAVKGLTERTVLNLYGGAILDEIMPVLSRAELGNRMTWNHRALEHTFEIYKGEDLTTGIHAVVFSDEQGTARDLVINDDESNVYNVGYGVAEYNETKVVEVVGDATGDDRHEAWFEIGLTVGEEETEEQFRERLRNHILMELGKKIRKLSFTVSVDPSEFGKLYNIGDVVSCVSKRFGVRFNARVSGMKYKKDGKSETTEIILGEPILTAIGR